MKTYAFTLPHVASYPLFTCKAKSLPEAWTNLAKRAGYGDIASWSRMYGMTVAFNKARFSVSVEG